MRFSKIIFEHFHGSFWDSFLFCDESNKAKVSQTLNLKKKKNFKK